MYTTSKLALVAAALIGNAVADAKPAMGPTPAADMQAVLDKLKALGAKPSKPVPDRLLRMQPMQSLPPKLKRQERNLRFRRAMSPIRVPPGRCRRESTRRQALQMSGR